MQLGDFCGWQDVFHLPALVLTEECDVVSCNKTSIALIPGLASTNVFQQLPTGMRKREFQRGDPDSAHDSLFNRILRKMGFQRRKAQKEELCHGSSSYAVSPIVSLRTILHKTEDFHLVMHHIRKAATLASEVEPIQLSFTAARDTDDSKVTCLMSVRAWVEHGEKRILLTGFHTELNDATEAITAKEIRNGDVSISYPSGTNTVKDNPEKPRSRGQRGPATSDQRKDQYLANISHKMRTPLNCISGFNQLLLHTNLDLEHLQWLQMSQCSCEQLLCLVNNLLDNYNVCQNAGKMKLELSDFDLQSVFQDTFKHATLGACKNLEFVCFQDRNTCWKVNGDAIRIRQILFNLLTKSINLTKQGGVTLRVEMLQTSPETMGTKPRVRFTIQDTGIGMTDADIEKLSKGFTNADTNDPHCLSAQRLGSSDLGFAITARLVKLMAGTIKVKSSVGAGSTFTVTLQLRPPQYAPASPQQKNYANDVNFRSRHIIVIAYSNFMLRFLHESLDCWGCTHVSSFSCQRSGMSYIRETNDETAIIIQSLCSMQELVEAAQIHREYRESALVRNWVLLTSHEYAGVARGMQNMHWRVIEKPIQESSLFECLSDFQHMSDNWMAQKGRILVVEDCLSTRIVISKMLESDGYNVDVAENGVEAMKALYRSRSLYALCIVDAIMPVKDGLQTVVQIRELEDAATLPIIAISISVSKCQLLVDNGANEFLVKPLKQVDLRSLVRRLSQEEPRKSTRRRGLDIDRWNTGLKLNESGRSSWTEQESGLARIRGQPTNNNQTCSSKISACVLTPRCPKSILDSLESTLLKCDVTSVLEGQRAFSQDSPTEIISYPLPDDDSSEGHLPYSCPLLAITENKSSLIRDVSEYPHGQLPNYKILAVDDNPINLKVLVQMLKVLGYTDVETRSNGKLGVEAVADAHNKGKPFSMIFMDHSMPVMDGFEASYIINSMAADWTMAPKVISLSANEDESERAAGAGMHCIISKPITFDKLRTALLASFGNPAVVSDSTS